MAKPTIANPAALAVFRQLCFGYDAAPAPVPAPAPQPPPAAASTFGRMVRCDRCRTTDRPMIFGADDGEGFLCRPCILKMAAEPTAADRRPIRLTGRRLAEWLEWKGARPH